MESPPVAANPRVGIELVALELHAVEFRRLWPTDVTSDPEISLSLAIGVARPSESDIIVHLTFKIEGSALMEASVKYGLRFRLADDLALEKRDDLLRTSASQLAPVIAYPYVRETINSLALKSGISNSFLPVVAVGAMIAKEQVEIPQVQG